MSSLPRNSSTKRRMPSFSDRQALERVTSLRPSEGRPSNREAHHLLEELAEAQLDGRRRLHLKLLAEVPLLIIDDLGMRKLPSTAAEDLLELVMRRYERASTLFTSNRPVED